MVPHLEAASKARATEALEQGKMEGMIHLGTRNAPLIVDELHEAKRQRNVDAWLRGVGRAKAALEAVGMKPNGPEPDWWSNPGGV